MPTYFPTILYIKSPSQNMYIRKLSFEGRKKYKQVLKVNFHVTVVLNFAPRLIQRPPLCIS